MNDNDKSGWFTDLVKGFFSLISVGQSKVDHYIQTLVRLLILFIVLSILLFFAGSALYDWVSVLGIDTASEAIGAAFSEAVQQGTSTDLPPTD